MAPPVGLVIGHSFVQGLQQHLDPTNQATPSDFARKLSLEKIVQKFHIHGHRGACITSKSYSLPHRLLTQSKPDFAILDLGSNDLASRVAPLQVATALIELADVLRHRYHIRTIMVCSIVNRKAHLKDITPEEFQTAAYETNNYLQNYADSHPHITYHVHKGFWAHPIDSWSRDGVHPNTPAGRTKYIKSIRKAVFLALQTFTSK